MYVNSFRRQKEDLKDERNTTLVQTREARAATQLRQDDYEVIKTEMMQKR